MKNIFLMLFCLLFATRPFAKSNDLGTHCIGIKNKGLYGYCMAKVTQNPTYCYAIKDSDRKNLCVARFGYPKACFNIKNKDLKNYCIAIHGESPAHCNLITDKKMNMECKVKRGLSVK